MFRGPGDPIDKVPEEMLLAFIKASDAYLDNPTSEHWEQFERLSDTLLDIEQHESGDHQADDESPTQI